MTESTRPGPQSEAHGYDNQALGPRGFLLAIMRAPNLPIQDRMDAAAKLLELWPELYDGNEPEFRYVIEGITVQ
jgi:hypothetical protein